MKLFKFEHWEDYGHEIHFEFLRFERFAVFRIDFHHSSCFDWMEMAPDIFFSFRIFGRCSLVSSSMNAWNVRLDLSLLERYFVYGH